MQSLQSDILLEYHPDTLQAVRKEFNLDKPGRIDEAINILEDWVKKQKHFCKKDFSRVYLELTLITTKGLVERAKTRLDKLCTFKTLMPDYFTDIDIDKIHAENHGRSIHAHLPKLTKEHYRVYIFKLLTDDLESTHLFLYYKYIFAVSEYLKSHNYSAGFILVLDMSDVNIMTFITKLNLVDFRNALTILMEGYGMIIKGIHFITPSKMIDALVSIFKQVLSEKMGNRIHVHKTVESLYEYVPKDIMPVEYGGKERSLKALYEEWIKALRTKEFLDYLRDMNEAKTIESCRDVDKFNENYIGMPGSFRSLSVD